MLYVNRTFPVQDREMSFGKLHGVPIGERGRGRYEVFLPAPQTLEKLEYGMHENLSIGKTKNGKPRINSGDDGNLYMIMSSEARYTRRGSGSVVEVIPDGDVMNREKRKVTILAEANGADGDAGRIGSWDAQVLQVKPGAIVKVIWGGYGYGLSPNYYFVELDGTVTEVEEDDVPAYYDNKDEEMPVYFQKKFKKEDA